MPLTTPAVSLGFLLFWTWGISSWLLQQSTATALYLGRGVSPHRPPPPPDLERGIAPLGPPTPEQPQLPGGGDAPPGCRPWPWAWSSSSQPFLCYRSLALSAAASDLGHGVTLLGYRPLGMGLQASASGLGRGVAPLGTILSL